MEVVRTRVYDMILWIMSVVGGDGRMEEFEKNGVCKTCPANLMASTVLHNRTCMTSSMISLVPLGSHPTGKSTMLKIMAGIDKEFEGTARPLPGASIGYLSQEPELEFETVQECVDDAVKSSQAILDQYNAESMKLADPDLDDDQMAAVMAKVEQLNDQIEAGDLWELERVVSRAMDALRVPAGDAKTAILSGGEKRRVALCRLLLSNHDMYVSVLSG